MIIISLLSVTSSVLKFKIIGYERFTFLPLDTLGRFDVNMIFLTSKQEQETSYTILRARGTNVTISSLKPDTTYVFQIRARTAAGYGSNSRKFEFETSPDCMYYFNAVYGAGGCCKGV